MALPDISTLTDDELVQLITNASSKRTQNQIAAAADAQSRRQSIAQAITTLEKLLGPTNAAKGTDSIRAIRQYTGAEMVSGASIALPLIFQALEILTTTQLNVAHVEALDLR